MRVTCPAPPTAHSGAGEWNWTGFLFYDALEELYLLSWWDSLIILTLPQMPVLNLGKLFIRKHFREGTGKSLNKANSGGDTCVKGIARDKASEWADIWPRTHSNTQ